MSQTAHVLTRPQKLVAVAITPLICVAHWVMDRYLGHETAQAFTSQAEAGTPFRPVDRT
jgi:hypothetical protein